MPKQKDLKRIVRSRMEKTGESYTAARLQLVKKKEAGLAERAGMSDASVKKQTGRTWATWVKVLDEVQAAEKPHREIAQYVSSLGTPDWWTQMVTVGYERIRGLRDKGQQRGGGYEATKSRTFPVPIKKLYAAFADARTRLRWLPVKVNVKSARPNKRMRLAWDDGTTVEIGFFSKADQKSSVALTHQKLPDKAAAEKMKSWWAERLDALGEIIQ
ncbi:MAG: hypothetical protein M3041_21080 [Acidobacteriota bacterium]|nr:hypothetical protein [Acidobacteriota bacterium]